MPLLLPRLGFSLKLHNHHHRHRHRHRDSRMSELSLRAFRSHVSNNLNQLLESLKLGSEFLSLKWIHQCFQTLPIFNNAFAKLMVEIDYPISSWEVGSIKEYLDYSISLLELLNSISSSLSHLNHARVSLSHALSLMESSPALAVERMREIKGHDSIKEFKPNGGDIERICNGKERVFHEAMLTMKSFAFWVCGVVLLGLKSESKPIMEIMRSGVLSDSSSLMALDSIVRKKFTDVEEVERVNETVRLIVSSGNGDSDVVKELKERLDVLWNGLKGLKEEEDDLFAKVMDARNEVMETLRRNNDQ